MFTSAYNKYLKQFENKIDTLNTIEVSKSAIYHNLQVYKELNPNANIFPVLKANAYGHGLIQLAQILKSVDLDYVCVDSYYEYLQIKDIINCKTLIIGYTKPNNYQYFDFNNLAITIYDIQSLKGLAKTKKKISVHLKIDTGMNRQGVQIENLPALLNELKKYSNIKLEGVMTHFSDADNPNDFSYSEKQIKIFNTALEIIRTSGLKNIKYVHIANSAGALKTNIKQFNAIRLGLGMYGYLPISPEDPDFHKISNLKPSLRFISTIIQTKKVVKGAKISYNLAFEAEKDMKIGIVPAGYYDGIDRRLSNIGFFSYNSQNLRILGRVCMNLVICDISDTEITNNNEIVIIDNKNMAINSVANIAKLCNTIPYVITTKLSESTRRVVVE
ncbi:alanine racemase [Patescibacteria group bacterium]